MKLAAFAAAALGLAFVAPAAAAETTAALVVHARDLPAAAVLSWKRGGRMFSVPEADRGQAPEDATRITLRVVEFPGASVREINMDKGQRTYPHDNDEDTLFYELSGRRVQIVNERSAELNPGDATLQPSGVMHQTSQLISGTFLEFAVPMARGPAPEAIWMKAGQAVAVREKGYAARVFNLPGYALTEARLASGGAMVGRDEGADTLFYMVDGDAAVTIGAAHDTVTAGDILRAPRGQAYGFEAPRGAVLLRMQTLPKAAARTDP